ncbi:hypothetical protein FACS1894111_03080 [Clostridia bacterium]|nr:hypothetical protein FACS1894111_03080 [Clostridia bacterium]
MIALHLPDLKDFMHLFLRSDLFDRFLLPEATITTYVTHKIDGHLHADFFEDEKGGETLTPADRQAGTDASSLTAQATIAPYSMLRPFCYELMKGKRSPLSFQFLFQLSPENQERTILRSGSSFAPSDVSALFLRLTYQGGQLRCTTGIAYQSFSLDKSLEEEWDRLVPRFFRNHGISCELL